MACTTGASARWTKHGASSSSPPGTARYDFYGGNRLGANLYANSVLALDAKTGKRKWHFQTVHHDLWDYDLATAPKLLTVKKDGRDVDVIAQASKTRIPVRPRA